MVVVVVVTYLIDEIVDGVLAIADWLQEFVEWQSIWRSSPRSWHLAGNPPRGIWGTAWACHRTTTTGLGTA